MRKFLALFLSLVLVLSLAACGGAPAEEAPKADAPAAEAPKADAPAAEEPKAETIRVGVLEPLTGGSASLGQYQVDGIQAYFDYINAQGGIKSMGGAQLEIVLADTESTPDVGVTGFERLVTKENVVAVMGTYNSNVGAAVAPLAIKYKMPFIVVNAVTDSILQTESNYIWRANNSDSTTKSWMPGFYKWVEEVSGKEYSKVAIVADASDWGQAQVTMALEQFFPQMGWEAVVTEVIQTNTADFSTTINKIKNSGAELVMPYLYLSDIVLFTQQMQEYQVNIPILSGGGGATDPSYVGNAGDAAEYVLINSSWFHCSYDGLTPKGQELFLKYEEEFSAKYGVDYEITEPFANGWMGAGVLVDALERAGTAETEALCAAIDSTNLKRGDDALLFSLYEGIIFDDVDGMYNQNPYASMMAVQIIDGQQKAIYPLAEGVENPLVWPIPAYKDR